MLLFQQNDLSLESYWRAVILFGKNTACYKFALAKALIDLAEYEVNQIKIEDLAPVYVKNICEHLKTSPRQGTNPSNKFLEACISFNNNEIALDDLITITIQKGFRYVFDAFHVVNQEEIPVRFFYKEQTKAITITDELYSLKNQFQYQNLPFEVESRWNLVETAWSLNIAPALLEVRFNEEKGLFFVESDARNRIDITSSRDALNGYQKGKCFYCFRDIEINPKSDNLADVDHFFPHTLLQYDDSRNLNGVWNLVLACKDCNRGENGKFAKVPVLRYLERLHKRNNFLIDSHHPLRETLIKQTGKTSNERQSFLQQQYNRSKEILIHNWEVKNEHEAAY